MVREARWDNDDVAVALHHDLDLGDALQLVAQLQRHAGGDFTAELCAMKRPKAVAQRPIVGFLLVGVVDDGPLAQRQLQLQSQARRRVNVACSEKSRYKA